MENFFEAGSFVDISTALNDPAVYQDIEHAGTAQPDYLIWSDEANSPYYVVECKGSQTGKITSYHQLRRGLEQVPAVVLGAGPRQVVTLVIATCLLGDHTEVFVLDPPVGPPDDDHPEEESSEKVSERTGRRTWEVRNAEVFRERAVLAEESYLLKWAGQYHTATIRDRRLERIEGPITEIPNAPLETKRTDFGVFRGIGVPLFPALGVRQLRMFTGVEEEVLESVIQERRRGGVDARYGEPQGRRERQPPDHLPTNMSVSRSGSCMIIDGL
jgi:hypothetical protein